MIKKVTICKCPNLVYAKFDTKIADYFSNDEWREIEDWLEKQKEQKPNFSEKDSTDFEIEVHEIIAQARNDSRLNDADVLKQFEEEAAFALMLKANKLIEQKPVQLPRWRKIKAGEKLPCCAYLYKHAYETENNFGGRATIDGYLVPNSEMARCECDTWYLPVDQIKNLPKEE